MKKERFKYIFSLRLAGYLMMKGFRIIRINRNLDISNKDVYVFNDSPELCQAMSEYSTRDSKEKYYGNNNKRSRSKTNWKKYSTL